MRFVSPVLFLAAAGGVSWYNGQHADRALVLPFMDVIDPGADALRQGELSVIVLIGVAVVLGVRDVLGALRARQE